MARVTLRMLSQRFTAPAGALEAIRWAIETQLSAEVAGLHNVDGYNVEIVDPAAPIAVGDRPIDLVDEPPAPGDLGDHYLTADGQPRGEVCLGLVLGAAGGSWLGTVGDDGKVPDGDVSVASTASHEAIEQTLNPFTNRLLARPDGTLVVSEAADPCQGFGYGKRTPAGLWVALSDFVLPAWGREGVGPYDYLARLAEPFTHDAAWGYTIQGPTAASLVGVYGSHLPDWQRAYVSRRRGAILRHTRAAARDRPTPTE